MITREELNPKGHPLDAEQSKNIEILLSRINEVRQARGVPMIVTSGFRSLEEHKAIYLKLAKQRGVSNIRVPMSSNHLKAAAVDISDPDGSLYQWTRDNEALLAKIGLWMEIKDDQKRVHFQIFPPKSGDRWFRP